MSSWYYSNAGQQQGPLDDTALDQLIVQGVVTPETYLWKEGQADWLPMRQVRPIASKQISVVDAQTGTCTMCGKPVGADNLIDLVGMRVCAACKPLAVQTLREGVTPPVAGGAWSDGNKVMTYDKTILPPRCFKCNAPATEPSLKRKLYWHPPLYYLLIFVSLIIYVVVAVIVRKRATVDVHLCEQHLQSRKFYMLIGWLGFVLGLLLLGGGVVFQMNWLIMLSALVLISAPIAGIIGASLARPARIKGDTVWLRGAGKEFLASLPRRN